MENNKKQEDFQRIKDHIQREKKAAQRFFQQRDFLSKLETRLSGEHQKKRRVYPLFKAPMPAFLLFLFISLIFAVVLVRIFVSPPTKHGNFIEKFLSQSTNLHKIMLPTQIFSETSSEYARFEWEIKWVLFSPHRKSLYERNLSEIFNQVLFGPFDSGKEIIKKKKDVRSMDMYQELEMLRKDKKYYEFFSRILDKLKEV